MIYGLLIGLFITGFFITLSNTKILTSEQIYDDKIRWQMNARISTLRILAISTSIVSLSTLIGLIIRGS